MPRHSSCVQLFVNKKKNRLRKWPQDLCAYSCIYFSTARENEVRERIPVPHDNYLESIISSRPHCKGYFCLLFPWLHDVNLLTDQWSAILKIDKESRIDWKKFSYLILSCLQSFLVCCVFCDSPENRLGPETLRYAHAVWKQDAPRKKLLCDL